MSGVNRKITYRLYANQKQLERLEHILTLHQRLYNAGLEQRIDAYRRQKKSLSFSDQCKELTLLRRELEEYRDLNAQSCQVTLKRLDLAFKSFFRRVTKGEAKVGFPRFKSKDRFPGFGFKTHGDGFGLQSNGRHGRLRLCGVGIIKIRGKARTFGEVKTAEVLKRNDRWYLSVTVKCQPKRKSGLLAFGIDWGVETFATVVSSTGTVDKIENPRYLRNSLDLLKKTQRNLSRKKKGSKNRLKVIGAVRKIHEKVAQNRKNHLHRVSAAIVSRASLISTEKLAIKNMTVRGGNFKKGLNREILNTAPGMFFSLLKYKAEEAGIFWKEIPTKRVKPSQTCSGCGRQEKKNLSQRDHECQCGVRLGRDENAARVILNWALTGNATGWVSARCGEEASASSLKQETLTTAS